MPLIKSAYDDDHKNKNDDDRCRHTFKQLQSHILDYILVPLAAVAGRLALPVSNVKLGESAGEVHDSDGDDLRLPLETQRCAQASNTDTSQMHGIWTR